MQLTCPRCADRFSLESAVEDECGRALMALLGRIGGVAREIVLYLGLFRPRTQALRWSRALALAEEIEQMVNEHGEEVVRAALRETIEAMRAKQGPGWRPLKNHGYLRAVLSSVQTNTALVSASTSIQAPVKSVSKTAQAIEMLRQFPAPEGIPQWFRDVVCGSLAELMLLGLEGVPAYDTLPLVAERWLTELWPKREWKKDSRFVGAKRLHTAFIQAAESRGRWPTVKDVLEGVPKA